MFTTVLKKWSWLGGPDMIAQNTHYYITLWKWLQSTRKYTWYIANYIRNKVDSNNCVPTTYKQLHLYKNGINNQTLVNKCSLDVSPLIHT